MNNKKIISVICTVLFLFITITGCNDNSQNDVSNTASSDNVSATDTSLPKTKENTSVSETDFQKNMNNGNFGKYISCETTTGYYFLLSNYICYADKSNMNTTILCNKPECKHNTTNCNAYLDGANSLTYYNGNIYYDTFDDTEGVYYLYKINMDGTDRTKVQELERVSGSTSNSPKYIIDNDVVYIKTTEISNSASATENISLYAVNVGDSIDKAVKIDSLNNVEFDKMWADSGKLYYLVTVNGSDEIYSYDFKDNKKENVWLVPSVSEVGSWASAEVGANGWYITDSCLYYFLSGNGMYKYDLSTKKNECIVKITDSSRKGIASFDNQYMYINCSNPVVGCSKNEICIYDLSGNYIGTVSYEDVMSRGDGYNDMDILCTSHEKLFIIGNSMLTNSEGYEYGIEDVFYISIANMSDSQFEKLEFDLKDYMVNDQGV